MLRSVCVIVLAFLAWSGSASSGDFDREEFRYRIEHELFGAIGEEKLGIRQDGNRVIIDRTVDVTVRFMLATLYERSARYLEIWQDGRLIRFEGDTLDDGERSSLVATLRAGQIIDIETDEDLFEASATVIPTDPWHQDIVDRRLLFDRLDGHLMNVAITDSGLEQLKIEGHLFDARKFTVTGQRHQDLWFEASSGVWLKSTIRHASGDIHITRLTAPNTHVADGAVGVTGSDDQLVRRQ